MSQVVERRLPAIYDALDSRNNKVLFTLPNQSNPVIAPADMTRSVVV